MLAYQSQCFNFNQIFWMLDTHLNGLAKLTLLLKTFIRGNISLLTLCKNFGMNMGIEGGGPSCVLWNKHHRYLVAMVNIRVACKPPCGRYSKVTFANCTKRWPYTRELYRSSLRHGGRLTCLVIGNRMWGNGTVNVLLCWKAMTYKEVLPQPSVAALLLPQ